MNIYNPIKYIILTLIITLIATPNLGFSKEKLKEITLVLDWTPNTNHTGIIVAKKLGYYSKEGLNIKIIQPGKGSTEQLVAKNLANFGISSESSLIEAYLKGMPLISIAGIIAHNTSGFYSLKEKKINTPKDFEGKVYGSWGSKLEIATIKAMMEKVGADFSKVKIITIGNTDFFKARNIDFVWGFEAWTGSMAKINNIPVNYISIKETINLDGYTPIIITNQTMINKNQYDVISFIKATAKGYHYACKNPDKAANILLDEYPELNSTLVVESQMYLTDKYKDKNIIWGYQNPKIWENYVTWMYNHKVIDNLIDSSKLFTNKFIKYN